jgi:hypothetical protein
VLYTLFLQEDIWPFALFENSPGNTISVFHYLLVTAPNPSLKEEFDQDHFQCWEYALQWATSRGLNPFGTIKGFYSTVDEDRGWGVLFGYIDYRYALAAFRLGVFPEFSSLRTSTLPQYLLHTPPEVFSEVLESMSRSSTWSWKHLFVSAIAHYSSSKEILRTLLILGKDKELPREDQRFFRESMRVFPEGELLWNFYTSIPVTPRHFPPDWRLVYRG